VQMPRRWVMVMAMAMAIPPKEKRNKIVLI
jgi:hypothetical protein